MGALLVEEWLGEGSSTAIVDEASVALVREEVRRVGREAGLREERLESLVVAASELAHNQLAHARGGRMRVAAVERDGVAGVEVTAADSGRGIADPSAALRGEVVSRTGLGAGLSAAYRMADEMDFDIRLGEGTCAVARSFAAPQSRNEVAILGRPCRGELVSGDHAVFARGRGLLMVAVCDGLGHGPAARDASNRATSLVRSRAGDPPLSLLADCDRALRHTRGAALSIAHLDLARGELVHAGTGNIISHLYQGTEVRRGIGVARVLGAPSSGARMLEERWPLSERYLLAMFSDGLSSRLDLKGDLALRRQPPLVIAHELIERFGQDHDDATVAVARLG